MSEWVLNCLHFYLYVVSVALYSPKRPAVDTAEVFLWLMAVGTILCASYWSAWTAREIAIEQDKLLKVTLYPFKSNFYAFFVKICSSIYIAKDSSV